MLVRYGRPIKERLAKVISVARPETLLAWNRRMKRRKWTFNTTPKRPGRPRQSQVTEELAVRLAVENVHKVSGAMGNSNGIRALRMLRSEWFGRVVQSPLACLVGSNLNYSLAGVV
jgi:hypothetical protein